MTIRKEHLIDEREIFQLADRALCELVTRIREDQWILTLSQKFARHGEDHPPTLREVVNAHAYDDAWVPTCWPGAAWRRSARTPTAAIYSAMTR